MGWTVGTRGVFGHFGVDSSGRLFEVVGVTIEAFLVVFVLRVCTWLVWSAAPPTRRAISTGSSRSGWVMYRFSGLFYVHLLIPAGRRMSFMWPVPSTGATY